MRMHTQVLRLALDGLRTLFVHQLDQVAAALRV
eukprot:CAMPEP_0177445098 /NCGR_PEP_ID=MMETSP0369-20130122/6356_1 /TAXON_ID=447022 ORGANISM="Scrippsiella hangoei-like, Strain SHHI-4" /NCGR_SAMPLE_ID=MMETSP0369 /ASSEMBLY_ACC=CAM_ASM_000364 /LENGTH=32 /DNA_ID= /DNA_START= /DNA_END= /DNA_ORIENTATION=